jgi:hypothetical protein
MMVMQNLTAGQVPNGFRQPKKGNQNESETDNA